MILRYSSIHGKCKASTFGWMSGVSLTEKVNTILGNLIKKQKKYNIYVHITWGTPIFKMTSKHDQLPHLVLPHIKEKNMTNQQRNLRRQPWLACDQNPHLYIDNAIYKDKFTRNMQGWMNQYQSLTTHPPMVSFWTKALMQTASWLPKISANLQKSSFHL